MNNYVAESVDMDLSMERAKTVRLRRLTDIVMWTEIVEGWDGGRGGEERCSNLHVEHLLFHCLQILYTAVNRNESMSMKLVMHKSANLQ